MKRQQMLVIAGITCFFFMCAQGLLEGIFFQRLVEPPETIGFWGIVALFIWVWLYGTYLFLGKFDE